MTFLKMSVERGNREMKYFIMKDGILVCPDNFRKVGEVVVGKRTTAYVVTSKNGSIDPIIYLCDMDMEELESWGVDTFLDYVAGEYPEIEKIIEREIGPIFSEDGKLLNATEYAMSDRIGVFQVKDVTEENELYSGCGIIRNKA